MYVFWKIYFTIFFFIVRAQDTKTNQIVALKRVKMDIEKDNGMPLTALREINLLRRAMKHPNVVHLKEVVVGYKLSSIFLVFEYCEHDLAALLERNENKKKTTFSEAEVKNLMVQLFKALDHLHKVHLVHTLTHVI